MTLDKQTWMGQAGPEGTFIMTTPPSAPPRFIMRAPRPRWGPVWLVSAGGLRGAWLVRSGVAGGAGGRGWCGGGGWCGWAWCGEENFKALTSFYQSLKQAPKA